jgi:hypothetical protein
MGDQPTNGPYHWGNGPQPQKDNCIKTLVKFIKKRTKN